MKIKNPTLIKKISLEDVKISLRVKRINKKFIIKD